MCALLKLLGKWIQVNLSFSAALNPASIDQAPRGNTIDQPCARLGMKLSKTPLCEERGVCGRWLTGGLVKMKIVVCQSTMFIWIRLKHVYTRMRTHARARTGLRQLHIAVCVCRRCERRKGCNSNLFHQQRSIISLNGRAARVFHDAQPRVQHTQHTDSQTGGQMKRKNSKVI